MQQPYRSHGPFDQVFDMSQLSAAMPQAGAGPYYPNRQPEQQASIAGLHTPPWSYPPYHEVQRSDIPPNRQYVPADDGMRRRRQDGSYGAVWPPPAQQFGTTSVSSTSLGRTQECAISESLAVATPPLPPQQQHRHEIRRRSVPSSPRGPPRKPRRSGYALWVGNLPPTARIEELKDHFSTGARADIDSVFLISKSNCAFVNYRTERACVAAMNRFHNGRFWGRALVCRLRKSAAAAAKDEAMMAGGSGSVAPTSELSSEVFQTDGQQAGNTVLTDIQPKSPLIVGRRPTILQKDNASLLTSGATTTASQQPKVIDGDSSKIKIPEKFFIMKSLTLEDLESSLTTRTWATQLHNEDVLNQAFEESKHVYLIFSANKSGEYFGYARMASPVASGGGRRLGGGGGGGGGDMGSKVDHDDDDNAAAAAASAASESIVDEDSLRMIATPATFTAPQGWIIDDSARGSIFWEADHSSNTTDGINREDAYGIAGHRRSSNGFGCGGGGEFEIEWQSTKKLPFYQTRGMRNSLNGNREIKIARDGQELDPRVGRRLLQLFRMAPGGPEVGLGIV